MDPDQLKSITEYSQKAIAIMNTYLDPNDYVFDHLCFQTASSESYEANKTKFTSSGKILREIPHAGRRIAILALNEPLNVDNVVIDRIEISEPKPKRSVKKEGIDHCAFYLRQDFKTTLNKLRGLGLSFTEEKQIGSDRLAKFSQGGIEIELRNNRIGEQSSRKEEADVAQVEETQEALKETISRLQDELSSEKESKLHALADYQNLQKRVEAERKQVHLFTNLILLREILDILDDFDRVLENLKLEEKDQVGIRLLREKLQKIVDASTLVEIECTVGSAFSAECCEAIGVVAVKDEKGNNSIRQIVQKGYKLKEGGQVVRPVKVIVGKFNPSRGNSPS